MPKRMLLAAFLVLCAAPAMAQSKAAIQKLDDAFVAAFNKGDAAAVAAMYAEDAYVLPDKGEMARGRAAIEKFWKGAMEQLTVVSITAQDVLPLGRSAAREIGTFALKTKAQPPQDITGKYVVVWRKIGGKWLLATDIWNSNK
ncbi:MAG TPA: SgcJ/EcaC family oxidoreductase [Stellaceae bacterium]|nr:SgcJ/EcaC family oxidoreductase [Stellaceae bacterium]